MTARLVAVPTPEGKDPVKFLTAAGLTPAAQAPILAILAANGKDYSVDYQRLWSDARDAWYTIIPTPSLYQVTAEEIVSLGLTEERTRHWKRFMDEMDDLYHVMHEIMGNVITNDTFFEVDGVLVPMREFLVPAEWKSVQPRYYIVKCPQCDLELDDEWTECAECGLELVRSDDDSDSDPEES